MTFLQLAKEILSKAKYPMTSIEIWEIAKKEKYDEKVGSKGQTQWDTMRVAIANDIKNRKDSAFCIVNQRPTTFWLNARKSEINIDELNAKIPESKKQKESFHERDLHPLLVKFLFDDENFRIHSKTIYHEKCKKKELGRSKWNYPDIVGVRFPFDRSDKTFDLLSNINQSEYKLYSFELKKSIDFSNLKECYFQAVSNSSFANEGYLVVFEYIDKEVLNDLMRLNASFGIGVIQLNVDMVDSAVGVLNSEIILPAMQRDLDIETLDMLVDESPDFSDFISDINENIRAKQQKLTYNKAKFDEVLSDDKLEAHIKKCGIAVE